MNLDRMIGDLRTTMASGEVARSTDWLYVAELDVAGSGVIYARIATRDCSGIEAQVRRLAGWCAEHDHSPRTLVAAVATSGARPYHERCDLHAVVDEAARGCEWVVAVNVCCVARRTEPLLAFVSALYDRDAHLFLRSMGGVPLVGVYLQQFLNARGEAERTTFVERLRASAVLDSERRAG